MKNMGTILVHNYGRKNNFGAVVEPLIMSTTFERDETGAFPEGRDIYSRASNPNRTALEKKIALMENGIDAACFASGQAAIMSIFHSLRSGDHIIIPDDLYYGTKVLIESLYKDWGLSFSSVDMTDIQSIERNINANTKVIWMETPSNPKLKITDINKVSELAKANNLFSVCDNTWSTPFFTQPFSLGVDLIMHSSTKYMGGHSDILGGVVIWNEKTDSEIAAKIRNFQKLGGAVPSAQDVWLLNRSLATFHLRMPRHAENAMALAKFLEKHPKIESVYYPGLESNEFHEIAKAQMLGGFGGMLSIITKGNEDNCLKIASKLKVFKHATSLGGVESLVDHRRTAEGEHSVSPDNLLRISVGIEEIEDLIEDFTQALL